MTKNPDNENLVLIDEDGNEVEFGFIGSLESEGNEYVVLSPIEGEEIDEIIIFKVDRDGEEEFLVEIEDDEEWEKVADLWDEISEDDEEE